jgi:hypothetical protein
MKLIGKTLLKALLLVVLFTATSVVLSTSGVKTISEARAGVKGQDVIDYLTGLGYTIIDLKQIEDSDDWVSHTILNGHYYLTIVHVRGNTIIDHEDSSL